MLETVLPFKHPRGSETEMGRCSTFGPTMPASIIKVMFGATVCCASMEASRGRPVPAKTKAPSGTSRAEATASSSIVVY